MTATDTLSQIRAILGATDTDPSRLAVAAFKLGQSFALGSSKGVSLTKTEARRVAGSYVSSAAELDMVLDALKGAGMIEMENVETGKAGRPQVKIVASEVTE